MGITISFQGTLKNTSLVQPLLEELTDIADTLNWEYDILNEDWSKPSTAALTYNDNGAEIIGDLSLKGISISLHPDCESLDLYFDSEGNLTTPMSTVLLNEGKITKDKLFSSVKTQFAPPDIHISIIKLLKYLKKRYIPDLTVFDEGDYWETGDKEILIRKISFINEKLDTLQEIIFDIEIENADQYSSEQLAKILEEKLRKGLEKN